MDLHPEYSCYPKIERERDLAHEKRERKNLKATCFYCENFLFNDQQIKFYNQKSN